MSHSLFLVDDHKVVRDGIKAILLARPDIQVAGEAGSIAEARSKIAAFKPDLLVIDLKLPDGNGADFAAEVLDKSPEIKCAILTSDPNRTDLRKAQEAGVLAFLTKDIDSTEYIQAFDKILLGQMHVSSAFASLVLMRPLNLTPRELDVLKGFADGLSYKEIASELDLSTRTVETHKNNMLKKMQVKSVVEMVRLAIREGLLKA